MEHNPWKQRMVSLYQHCFGALAVGFREVKKTQQLLQMRFKMTLNVDSLIIGGHLTTTIGFDSGSCSFHPPMKPPWRAVTRGTWDLQMPSRYPWTLRQYPQQSPEDSFRQKILWLQELFKVYRCVFFMAFWLCVFFRGRGWWGRDAISFWHEWYNTLKYIISLISDMDACSNVLLLGRE